MIATKTDPIAEVGCFDGQQDSWIHPKVYFASDRISRSQLLRILESPAAFKDNSFQGSRATFRGDCAHAQVLEPDRFESEYAYPPADADRRSKLGKEAWEKFTKSIGWVDGEPTEYAKQIVGWDYVSSKFHREDVDSVRGIARRIGALPKVQSMLQGPGFTEPTFCFDVDGIRLRVRPDRRIRLASGEYVLLDFKTTSDASMGEFSRSIAKYLYHAQAAMYMAGVSAATGIEHKRFLFIVAETKSPYAVQLYELDQPSIDRGRELYLRALAKLRECTESNNWPDGVGQLRPIGVPAWALKD